MRILAHLEVSTKPPEAQPEELFVNPAQLHWRGIVKDELMLVAAHAPGATEGETSSTTISYQGQPLDTITVTGTETWLGVLPLK